MGILTEIEAALDALPDERKEHLLAFLAAKLGRTMERIEPQHLASPRCAGLHAGEWELVDDFDEPLPDEIWLGNDV